MIIKNNEAKLIEIYMYICDFYEKDSKFHCERFSNNNNPDTDLILMDIKMPIMDGHEATRQIRQFNKDVIIIAQTARGLTGDRENAIVAGCNAYILKPIIKDELMTLIHQYFIK